MSKPLSCAIVIDTSVDSVYKTLLEQQLLYFQHFNPKIKALHTGVKISRDFYTKLNGKAVKGTTTVKEMKENTRFVMVSAYGASQIIQSFTLQDEEGKCRISYSEENIFEKKNMEASYGITSWFYTWSFNRQTKKRLRQLGGLACQ